MLFPTSHGPEEDALLSSLAAYRFDAMGFTRSHADFYAGEGWFLTLALVVVAAFTWMLGELATEQPSIARRLAPLSMFFSLGSAVLAGAFFVPPPLVVSALAFVAATVAWLRLRTS